MKKYIDIENIRFKDIKISEDKIRFNNIGAFEVGDEVVIQEKIDGSCASFKYILGGKFEAYSRRKKLTADNNLNGFYQYCEQLASKIYEIEKNALNNYKLLKITNESAWDGVDPEKISFSEVFDYDKFLIFGEWTGSRNKIVYKKNPMNKWFIFDVFNLETEKFLPYKIVQLITDELELVPVQTLAVIPYFTNWDTIKPFANPDYSVYGDTQEGIIIKNQSKLDNKKDSRRPIYLKMVNKKFKETKINQYDKDQKDAEFETAKQAVTSVVTDNRIEKCLKKLQNEGVLPKKLNKQDLKIIMPNLPKFVLEDAKKEEPEIMEVAGKYAGKISSRLVLEFVKKMI